MNQEIAAQQRLIELCKLAQRRIKYPVLEQLPSLSFDQRGCIAGSAIYQKNHIKLNRILLEENPKVFFDEVIAHELSHIIAYQLHGAKIKPHGKEWQSIMRDVFQLNPKTKHNLNVDTVKSKEFDYECDCGPIKLTLRRHNMIIRGKRAYNCRVCSSRLRPIIQDFQN